MPFPIPPPERANLWVRCVFLRIRWQIDLALEQCIYALFQDDVRFRDLGSVIVDEQHRFGVHQVHGRLKATEREPVMADFAAGALDLLVATTVIEVGVDVPNASLMIVELHQSGYGAFNLSLCPSGSGSAPNPTYTRCEVRAGRPCGRRCGCRLR